MFEPIDTVDGTTIPTQQPNGFKFKKPLAAMPSSDRWINASQPSPSSRPKLVDINQLVEPMRISDPAHFGGTCARLGLEADPMWEMYLPQIRKGIFNVRQLVKEAREHFELIETRFQLLHRALISLEEKPPEAVPRHDWRIAVAACLVFAGLLVADIRALDGPLQNLEADAWVRFPMIGSLIVGVSALLLLGMSRPTHWAARCLGILVAISVMAFIVLSRGDSSVAGEFYSLAWWWQWGLQSAITVCVVVAGTACLHIALGQYSQWWGYAAVTKEWGRERSRLITQIEFLEPVRNQAHMQLQDARARLAGLEDEVEVQHGRFFMAFNMTRTYLAEERSDEQEPNHSL